MLSKITNTANVLFLTWGERGILQTPSQNLRLVAARDIRGSGFMRKKKDFNTSLFFFFNKRYRGVIQSENYKTW